MNFGDEFGFEDDKSPEEKDLPQYVIVQTLDKKIMKVLLDEPEPEEVLEVPNLCSEIQATQISGSECVVGLTQ